LRAERRRDPCRPGRRGGTDGRPGRAFAVAVGAGGSRGRRKLLKPVDRFEFARIASCDRPGRMRRRPGGIFLAAPPGEVRGPMEAKVFAAVEEKNAALRQYLDAHPEIAASFEPTYLITWLYHENALDGLVLTEGEIRMALEQHVVRSEEHTSELQSRENLVCRLRLE